jgi:hypothetical protein
MIRTAALNTVFRIFAQDIVDLLDEGRGRRTALPYGPPAGEKAWMAREVLDVRSDDLRGASDRGQNGGRLRSVIWIVRILAHSVDEAVVVDVEQHCSQNKLSPWVTDAEAERN